MKEEYLVYVTIPVGRFEVSYQKSSRYVPSVLARQGVFLVEQLGDLPEDGKQTLPLGMEHFCGASFPENFWEKTSEEWLNPAMPLFCTQRPFSWSETPLREIRLTEYAYELLSRGFVSQEPQWEKTWLDYDYICRRAQSAKEREQGEESLFHAKYQPDVALTKNLEDIFPEMPFLEVLNREEKEQEITCLQSLEAPQMGGRRVPCRLLQTGNRFSLQTSEYEIQNYFSHWNIQELTRILKKENVL